MGIFFRNTNRRSIAAALACSFLVGVLAMSGCSAQQAGSSASSASGNAVGEANAEPVEVNVASLKGPTSIGIVELMREAKEGETRNDYRFTISGTADEVLPSIIQGNTDIALIPANAAATVYNKTNGGISVIDINTLGVLYVVSGDEALTGIEDLAGKTVYMTGAGTTPEYVMDYLLSEAGIADSVKLEFKSEAAEVAAVLNADPAAIGVLPEPYVTSLTMRNDSLAPRISLTQAWDSFQSVNDDGVSASQLVTGVTVVRNAFLAEHPSAVREFLERQAVSVAVVNADPSAAAELVVEAGIMEKAAAAAAAIPRCNLVCLTGEEMKSALSGYLQVLYDRNPASVGGALPENSFYYEA